MAAILRFSGLYAAIILVFGFAFGTLRVLFLAPVIGEMAAVMVEVPLMLVLSYLVSARLVARAGGLTPGQGIEIGLASFLLLQVAESLLAGLFGSYDYLTNVLLYWDALSPPRLVGLFGQIVFAATPLFQLVRIGSHER